MKSPHAISRESNEAQGLDSASASSQVVDEQTVIPVLEEQLDVQTRRVETDAGVRVRKTVQEREERVDEPLMKEEVDVERIAVNRTVDAPVAVRYEGDTMIVPVLEEVLVVEKRLVLKEEIRITRRRSAFHAPQNLVLRREHATVERIEDPGSRVEAAVSAPSGEGSSDQSLLDEKRRQNEEVLRKLR